MAFKWILKYIKRYKLVMALGLFLVAICSAMSMISPYISGKIVSEVIQKGNTKMLIPLVTIVICVTSLRSIFRYAFQYCFEYVSQNTIFDIREEIYKNLQRLDFNYFDRTRTGDIMARMTGDIDAVRHFVSGVVYMTFENVLIFIFALVVMFSFNAKFTLVLILLTPVIGYFARKLSLEVKPAFSGIRIQFSRLNSTVQENISGNRVVKAFAKEDYEIEKFNKENLKFKEKSLKASSVWGKYLPILESLSGVFAIIMILLGGIWVINGKLTVAELVTFNSLVFALNNPMRMAGWLINDIQRFAASGEKLIELLKADTKICNIENPHHIQRLDGRIVFSNVSFSYDGEEAVLRDINLEVNPGDTIGIIGATGSGKSTLMSLLCRFYDCSSGSVSINGVDIKDIDLHDIRSNVATAMQDIFLFSDTIEGNIAYGVPEASFERVKKAAEMAGADEFIMKFPEGYNTIIGERGVGLSGGQRQRIALARALIKNPSILILDDTTSAVDMETEHAIQVELNKFNKGITTFIIAHRISSVKNASKIIILDEGRIIEQGNHQELMAKKRYYYDIYMNQFGSFEESSKRQVV